MGLGAPLAGSGEFLWGRACPVERKILPRLEADNHVVFHFKLDPALLAAKTTVSLHDMVGVSSYQPADPSGN